MIEVSFTQERYSAVVKGDVKAMFANYEFQTYDFFTHFLQKDKVYIEHKDTGKAIHELSLKEFRNLMIVFAQQVYKDTFLLLSEPAEYRILRDAYEYLIFEDMDCSCGATLAVFGGNKNHKKD